MYLLARKGEREGGGGGEQTKYFFNSRAAYCASGGGGRGMIGASLGYVEGLFSR